MDRGIKESDKQHKLKLRKTKYQLLKTLLLFATYQKKKESTRNLKLNRLVAILAKSARWNFHVFRNRLLTQPLGKYCKGAKIIYRFLLKSSFRQLRCLIERKRESLERVKRCLRRNLEIKRQSNMTMAFSALRCFSRIFSQQNRYFENYVRLLGFDNKGQREKAKIQACSNSQGDAHLQKVAVFLPESLENQTGFFQRAQTRAECSQNKVSHLSAQD